jgi:4a-hydroxytetrahydrobiopterin dehydratase
MKVKLLTKAELTKGLKKLPQWSSNQKATVLTYTRTFKNHVDALVFIARITVHAQVMNHHPEIVFSYNKVKVSLSTHDVKGLTKQDIALATKISSLQ